MAPKPIITNKPADVVKSVIVIPSRIDNRAGEIQGEETEIAAQITIPHEGGWGWMVVFASFWNIFILDGVSFTFGSIYVDMTQDLGVSDSLVALLNSLAIAIYFLAGPLASALMNRYGFRAITMAGSVVCSFSLLCTYFSSHYAAICIFYGVLAGFGYALINLASSLVVGFYFEKLRSLAFSISTSGSSIGIMIMYPLNDYIVKITGWRTVVLLHSGLFGLIFFFGMTYKPLLSLTVTKTTDDPTRTVTYLPSISTPVMKSAASKMKHEGLVATPTERLFSAVSNANFPTAAAVVEEGMPVTSSQPGPSAGTVSKLTITARVPQGGMTHQQNKQVQSIMSRSSVQDKTKRNLELTVNVQRPPPPKKRKCCPRLCNWEDHIPESRPMYRDDAFFGGNVEKLPAYQKSMMDTTDKTKTGIEYQLAVSRAVTAADLEERRGVCTTAVRRILATMMDPALLKKRSFIVFCTGGFLVYIGYLIPYVFVQDRNLSEGVPPYHCTMIVSVIALANTIGRLIIGAIACKMDPAKLFMIGCIMSGIPTMLSSITYDIYYQYAVFSVFGFFISSLATLRSLVLVDLYGLEKLTNATGMMLLFQGIGSLISTPLASVLKNNYGYTVSFYIAGSFMIVSGIFLIPIKIIAKRDK